MHCFYLHIYALQIFVPLRGDSSKSIQINYHVFEQLQQQKKHVPTNLHVNNVEDPFGCPSRDMWPVHSTKMLS